jgi:hypothetical protein
MTSLGGLSLTTLASIGPDVVPADIVRGVPGGLLVFNTTPALAAPPSRLRNTTESRSIFVREPFPWV